MRRRKRRIFFSLEELLSIVSGQIEGILVSFKMKPTGPWTGMGSDGRLSEI